MNENQLPPHDVNFILHGDCLERLADLPADSVQCCMTSPPYYGLRDYGTAEIVTFHPECQHDWSTPPGPRAVPGVMHAQKRNEKRSVPDVAQAFIQPRKPAQRDGLPKSRHVQSRRIAQCAAILSAFSRRSPSLSQVPPAPFALYQPQEQEGFQ